RTAGHGLDVGLVVLPEIRGVGARHGTLVTHPGDGAGGVEAARERDADALADGKRAQDLGHPPSLGRAACLLGPPDCPQTGSPPVSWAAWRTSDAPRGRRRPCAKPIAGASSTPSRSTAASPRSSSRAPLASPPRPS